MKEIFLSKWSNWFIMTKQSKELNEAFAKELDALIEHEIALLQSPVVGQSEQLAEHKCKPMVNADWTYLRCECGKRVEPKG